MPGPLDGLRVLELATGVAGPYAGRLLAMLGASVVKLEPAQGDPVWRQAIDSQPIPEDALSPLAVHLNAGKRRVASGAAALEPALRWADVVIDSRVRRELRDTPLDPQRLREVADAPLLVTTCAWGFDADQAGAIEDELLVQARSGVMSHTGDVGGPPLRLPGFQSQYLAGVYAAVAALAGLRRPGCVHVDVPWVACIATGAEGGWAQVLQTGRRGAPTGPRQLDAFPSGALPCADGFVVPGTVRPADWVIQCGVYGRTDLLEDPRFFSRKRRRSNHEELWAELAPWYAARTRAQIFDAALAAGWACGKILRGGDVAMDPHMRARGFVGPVAGATGRAAQVPLRPWLGPELPLAAPPRVAEGGEDDAWFRSETVSLRSASARRASRAPLADLRILELTQAWAGPLVGRTLGALGADVVKIESAARPDGWRTPERFGDAAKHAGRDPDELSIDISPNYNSVNRNKRHCAIDLTQDAGRWAFLELVARADVVVANMTARVLPNLRLAYGQLRAANERLILIHMPALGASGPSCQAASYGSIIEGMGGFGALFGWPEEGARISATYYPDSVAGVHATLAVLSMLERRERTGKGGEVDLSHQETLWLQLGEAIVAAGDGREVERLGNRMPGMATSGVFPARDERWVAVASRLACDALLVDSQTRSVEELLEALGAHGASAVEVLHCADGFDSAVMAPHLERVRHCVTGETSCLRVPLRIDGAALHTKLPAPGFDGHTREVFEDWLDGKTAHLEPHFASGALGGAPDPVALREYYLGRRASPASAR